MSALLRRPANPGIYAGAVIAALLVVAAYQVRPSYNIVFGSPTDAPLLQGFNASEQTPDGTRFRWTTSDARIMLQNIGRQDVDVAMSLIGSRPEGQPPLSLTVKAGDLTLLKETPPPGPRTFTFAVPREAMRDGSLQLGIEANAFSPPGDPRMLGVMLTDLRVVPSPNPDRFIEPPLAPLLAVGLAALLFGLALSLLGWAALATGLGGVLVGALAFWMLVADRLWLTSHSWYSAWPQALLAGMAFVGLVAVVGGPLLRRAGVAWSPFERRALLTLMLCAFVIRLAGQLHPQIFIVDLLFHAHRFETVQGGQLLFTIQSDEWGGHSTFYLPTPYVMMLPLYWLLGDELLVIRLFSVAISTLGALPLFALGKAVMRVGRAGLIGSTLYLTFPIAVLPFSWGITSNLFGEFFALCSFAVLVTGIADLSPRRPAFWGLLFCLTMALLSHPGVVQLTGLTFALVVAILLLVFRRGAGRVRAVWAITALAAAAGLSYAVYYGHFAPEMLSTLQQIRAERAAQTRPGGLHLLIGGSVSDKSLGLVVKYAETRREWFFGGLRGFWQEAQAYYKVWPIAGALLGYGLLGLTASSRRSAQSFLTKRQQAMLAAAAGWLLAVLLFAAVGWLANLYVRYALFALPVLALGCGILLSRIWQQSRWGTVLCLLLLAFYGAEAVALWQFRITYAFK